MANSVTAVAIQADGKIIIGGQFTSVDTYTRDYIARLENPPTTSTSLTSTINPSQLGQSITFTATVSPITATGTVTFTFGGSVNTSLTTTLSSGVATYVTSTLPAGQTPVTATYGSDATYLGRHQQ